MIDFSSEIQFKSIRSSGPGGQNVNKVETTIIATWDVLSSHFFTHDQKLQILQNYSKRIVHNQLLRIKVSQYRTQLQNKKSAIHRLLLIVDKALIAHKKRVPTKPSQKQKEKRLTEKKRHAEKKESRRKTL